MSSQNILLAKLVQIDLDMIMLKPNNTHEPWRDTRSPAGREIWRKKKFF